jgi:hypothetical protein
VTSPLPLPRPANLEPLPAWKRGTLADTGAKDPVTCRCGREQPPFNMLAVTGLEQLDATYLCVACVAGSWQHPTLADTGVTESVRCRCGRLCEPVKMMDVKGIPAAQRAEYLCVSCVGELAAQDLFDTVEFHGAKGAPDFWLDWWEGKLLRRGFLCGSLPQRVWGEILARQYDQALAEHPPEATS